MSGSWIHPNFAWGLLTLLIPLVIHLWNRKQGKLIRVGSIQLISASESARASRIRLHEVWLWLVRSMLVVALVALLMGWEQPQPSSESEAPSALHWVDPAVADFLPESLIANETEAYWLGSTTVPLSEPSPLIPESRWASLVSLAQLASRPDTLVLYTELTTERWPLPAPPLPFVVVWNHIPSPNPVATPIQQWNQQGQRRQWNATTDEYTVQVSQKSSGTSTDLPPHEIRIHLALPEVEKAALENALGTVAEYVRAKLVIVNSVETADLTFWWEAEPPHTSDSLRVVTPAFRASPRWWTPHPSEAHRVQWHHPIRYDSTTPALWAELPVALMDLILPKPPVAHPVPATVLSSAALAAANSPKLADRRGILLVLVFVLLITERGLAAWRKS